MGCYVGGCFVWVDEFLVHGVVLVEGVAVLDVPDVVGWWHCG